MTDEGSHTPRGETTAGDPSRVSWSATDPVEAPDRIGPYRILRTLGEGGMGVVYEAEQTEPVRRRVAIKLIRAALGFDEFIARFEAERQALAVMEHPNIATVLEAGATETGIPYLVLEFVAGVPLTEYCDTHRLTIEQRLRLFVPVCRAIQHAHQKGVIHRDLKPSNVLVTEQAGTPEPKVIDFGLAKAMDMRLTERSIATAHGLAVGTPAYMSPEQAEGTNLDIDTRTDIYALGVMLYELLVGRLPVDPSDMGVLAFIARLVSHTSNPPTPSSRISRADATAVDVAAQRGTEWRVLRRELKGDLDWIVMRAIAPERERRYETANGLALDILRYLAHEPIVARPPSAAYRFRKFTQRHTAAVVAAAVVVLAVLGGVLAATVGLVRATRAEALARQEAERAAAVNDFVQTTLGQADPWRGGDRLVTLEAALEQAAERIDEFFDEQPLIAAEARRNIGRTLASLGNYEVAEPLLLTALEGQERELGESIEVATTRRRLGNLYRDKGEYETSEEFLRTAVDMLRRVAGPSDERTVETILDLGSTLVNAGKYDEAEALLQEVVAIERERGDSLTVAAALIGLATVARERDADFQREDSLDLEALAMVRGAGENGAQLVQALSAAATSRLDVGEHEDAERLHLETIELSKRVFGSDHPEVAIAYENLGGVYFQLRQLDKVLETLTEVLRMRERALGDESMVVGRTLANMATVALVASDFAPSLEHGRRARDILERTLGPDHQELSIVIENIGRAQMELGRYAEAATALNRAIEIQMSQEQPNPRRLARHLMHLGRNAMRQRRYGEAERHLLRSLEIAEDYYGSESNALGLRNVLQQLVTLYERMGRSSDAARFQDRLTPNSGNE